MKRIVGKILLMFAMLSVASCQAPKAYPLEPLPRVAVIHANRGTVNSSVTLPGDLVGYYQSTLYSKVTGYLKSISVDKGDWVSADQVLAIIEVPELDQQVARAQASLEIERLSYQRLESVWKSDPRLVARQDVDIAYAKYQQAKANVDELLAMDSYTHIKAPFDGMVTERFVDPGALIHAGGQQSANAPLPGARSGGTAPVVSIARLDKLRIYVYVPQDEVDFVRQGMPATVTVEGPNGVHFSGTVARFAHSLDLATRTMLTEVDLDNPAHQLYPGMYANVALVLQCHPNVLRLPVAAIGGDQARKVLLVKDGRLAEVPITTGIRDGRYVEITSGLTSKDLVLQTFSDTLQPGERVNPDMKVSSPSSPFASTA
jgi:multidrug efflux pump subunit AcrA (membrane-fusion protein)